MILNSATVSLTDKNRQRLECPCIQVFHVSNKDITTSDPVCEILDKLSPIFTTIGVCLTLREPFGIRVQLKRTADSMFKDRVGFELEYSAYRRLAEFGQG